MLDNLTDVDIAVIRNSLYERHGILCDVIQLQSGQATEDMIDELLTIQQLLVRLGENGERLVDIQIELNGEVIQ